MTANKSGTSPDKRRKYDEAFRAEARRLASESRSTRAAARQLCIRPQRLYRWRIRRVLQAHGQRAQQPRSFVPRTTGSDPAVRAAPNRVRVGDTTHLPRQGGGGLCLAAWLNRCSRKGVGWDVREARPEALVSEALPSGLRRTPAPGRAHRAFRPGQSVPGRLG